MKHFYMLAITRMMAIQFFEVITEMDHWLPYHVV